MSRPTRNAAPAPEPKPTPNSTDQGSPSLAELLKAARAATPQERKQIAKEVGATGGAAQTAWRAASLLSHQISELERLLAVSADEAALLLGDGHYSGSADLEALANKLAGHIDGAWEDLAPQLELLNSLLGAQGQRLLRKAAKHVNKAREKRGATTIAVVLAAAEQARSEILAQAMREDGEAPNTADLNAQMAARIQELAEVMLGEHIHQLGKDPRQLVAGYLTGPELHLLSTCKHWVEQHGTLEMRSDINRFCSEVWKTFHYCKRRGFSSPQAAKDHETARVSAAARKLSTTDWSDTPRVTDITAAMDSLRRYLEAQAEARGISKDRADPGAIPLP
jgi:hypothetical protein